MRECIKVYGVGMNYKAFTLGFVLAGTVLGSGALTLGRARGAAWIGQPLELIVPLQIEPGQSDGGLCAEADVFHGDSRQDASRVQVQVTPTDQPDTFNIKINSSALIDEPVVSVYVRAGCSQKSSRKFVLLADYPSDLAATPNRAAIAVPPQVPTVVPTEPVAATLPPNTPPSATSQITSNPVLPTKASRPVAPEAKDVPKPLMKAPKEPAKEATKAPTSKKEASAKAPKSEKPAPTVAQSKPEGAVKPRLRLDPIETLSERVKTLESTTTATSLQDDLARDSQKMQLLQADLRTLLDQAVKNEAALAAMRERLEKAESERVPVAVVYGLIGLVILTIGALALLWSKRPKQLPSDAHEIPAQVPRASNTAASSATGHDIDIDVT